MTIYAVPDVPETDETLCMQITIPDKYEYRVAFWTAMYHFAKWVAWERDGSDRATRAAQVWKPLIMAARERYEEGLECGECDMDIRQNPDDPCSLEYDIGAGWVQFADMTLCKQSGGLAFDPYPDGITDAERMNGIGEIIELFRLVAYSSTPGIDASTLYTNMNTWLNAGAKGILGNSTMFEIASGMSHALQTATWNDVNRLRTYDDIWWRDLAAALVCTIEEHGHYGV